MDITDIRIRLSRLPGKMKAVVSVTFDDIFAVHDMKIIEGQGGLFVAMPNKKLPTGETRDVAHPINAQGRRWLEEAILEEYGHMPREEELQIREYV